mmetsp:Transcript_27998/g.56542  ORF Transcript_27998/g.56542 Transcript_27998/m.56542 type:complete len:84 (+) Transcript_27998:331-582(+)
MLCQQLCWKNCRMTQKRKMYKPQNKLHCINNKRITSTRRAESKYDQNKATPVPFAPKYFEPVIPSFGCRCADTSFTRHVPWLG